jgi:hypothetical protein
MTFFADLTPFTYGHSEADPTVLNIGWLSCDHPIPVAAPNDLFVTALETIAAKPINPYRGYHICDFCPPPPVIVSKGGLPMLDPPAETKGNGEIWIKGLDGITYVAPALLPHYVLRHHYAPPRAFIDAVIASA